MRRCPDCREQVPTHETRCPSCDASLVRTTEASAEQPDPARFVRVYVIAAFAIVGGGLVACGGGFALMSCLGRDESNIAEWKALEKHRDVRLHMGRITSVRWDPVGSANEPDQQVHVFRVEGERASGYAWLRLVGEDPRTVQVVSGTIELDDGRKFDLRW